jgi:hypothetical protein
MDRADRGFGAEQVRRSKLHADCAERHGGCDALRIGDAASSDDR